MNLTAATSKAGTEADLMHRFVRLLENDHFSRSPSVHINEVLDGRTTEHAICQVEPI